VTSCNEHLRRALADDAARPRLTFYDDATGERVELSTTTLANWVSKTVNFLVVTCGVEPGSRVSLHLPRHWLLAVWVLAADAVGAEIVVGAVAPAPIVDVAVVGPEILSTAPPLPDADEVVACSLLPMAAPFRDPLPAAVHDFSVEVRAMPDQVAGPIGHSGPLGELAEHQASALGLSDTDRVAALGPDPDQDALVREWLAPLAAGASVLWVRNPDGARCVGRWEAERVTAVVAPVPDGLAVPESIRILD
jgi:uncharacterized protein (TIGR03089 family)